jgi:hypothetical protein
VNRPVLWTLFVAAAIASAIVAVRYFPDAFSIVTLEITMDRERALADAREVAARERLGPPDFREAASFTLDSTTQTFVELEAGGKAAFTAMIRDGLYSAYTWRVRHFRDGETNETTLVFTPDGRPYGFREQLAEDAPGAALTAADARATAEREAARAWRVDLSPYSLAEEGQERRPGGRVDHTFTYERATPVVGEGRYRLRLVVSGDRLTEVAYFVKIPEAFLRRYEHMRSANDAIGAGGAIAMGLLYVVGGIGVGLFFMLRQRWVLLRTAALWGVAVAGLQALAMINAWPLQWMFYDTAVPSSTFLAQQMLIAAAAFVGFAVFFAISFAAAETLTRRAFGHHPQLWRVWRREPGSSREILGRTVAGYLLVPIFLAYEVGLYLFATRTLGWWTPSEMLVHPDVLATYVPWFTAIANSLQAGFWEECLFRAVPIAGAALIGDRFGRRRLFIVLAFIVQAVIFGAGHAPYPAQPSFARPVELLLPSIGFGLLYLYFGLLPAIVLHFAFDVVWFALPIFLADAPGIWLHQAMVVVMTMVPMWIVLRRRGQVRHWTRLQPEDLNAAWSPPVSAAVAEIEVSTAWVPRPALVKIWMAIGAVGLLIVAFAMLSRSEVPRLPVPRDEAVDTARRALEARSVTLDSRWRYLPIPDSGAGGPHEFVFDTAGEIRWRELLGVYLPNPRWNVRVATFEGDLAERAEEWLVFVRDTGDVRYIRHSLPEARPGATLAEAAARELAHAAIRERIGLDAARGQVKEISAQSTKRAQRLDWTFAFADAALPRLPSGELRIAVEISGDEITSVGRFVHVPEEWTRRARAAGTRNSIVQVLGVSLSVGLLVAATAAAILAWSRRRRFSPRAFVLATAIVFACSVASAINGLPLVMAMFSTAQPLQLQLAIAAGASLVAFGVMSLAVGLAVGALPPRLASIGRLPNATTLRLGLAAGFVAAAVMILAGWFRTPPWSKFPDLLPLGGYMPWLGAALEPATAFVVRTAVLVTALVWIDRLTAGWTRHRAIAFGLLGVVGILGFDAPAGLAVGGWLAAVALMAIALPVLSIWLLRADVTMVPIALAVMAIAETLGRAAGRAYPGALVGGVAGALLIALLAWWLFRTLRASPPAGSAEQRPLP